MPILDDVEQKSDEGEEKPLVIIQSRLHDVDHAGPLKLEEGGYELLHLPMHYPEPPPVGEIDLATVDSAVLRRLIEEVRNEEAEGRPNAYNRIHNRHNRSGYNRSFG
jgi:hypothetical protein